MSGKAKRIINFISSVFVGLIVILAVLLAGVKVFGIEVYTVLSGSMEPAYHVGSLIYVWPADPAELEVGDVITFRLNETMIATHRIAEITGEGSNRRFITKGDANDHTDAAPVSEDDVIGSPVLTIPYLGYFAAYIQNPPGTYAAAAFSAFVLILLFVPELFKDGEKKKSKADPEEDFPI